MKTVAQSVIAESQDFSEDFELELPELFDFYGLALQFNFSDEPGVVGSLAMEVTCSPPQDPNVQWVPYSGFAAITDFSGSKLWFLDNKIFPFKRARLKVTADETVNASLAVQDITYTAVVGGEAGDDITIEYEDTGEAGEETVVVDGTSIVVGIESGVSTATEVLAAIEASPEALALISAEITGTAGTAQVTAAETPLAGGAGGPKSARILMNACRL